MKESRKTQYTRKALTDGLIELMKHKPFDRVTVKELCDYADVNRSTFYTHYEDIYALLHAIEEETLEWMNQCVEELSDMQGREAIVRSLERYFEFFIKNSTYLQVLMSEQGNLAFQKKIYSSTCQVFGSEGRFAPNIEENLRFHFVIHGGIGITQQWLKNGLRESPHELAEMIYDMTRPIW